MQAMDFDGAPDNDSLSNRIRNTRTCDHCRRRKTRCDRLQPCSRCRNNGLQCIFSKASNLPRGRNGGRRKTDTALDTRIEKLESLVKQVMEMASSPVPGKPHQDFEVNSDPGRSNVRSTARTHRSTLNPAERHLATSVFANLCHNIDDLAQMLCQSSDDEDDNDVDQPWDITEHDHDRLYSTSFFLPTRNIVLNSDVANFTFSSHQVEFILKCFTDNVDPVVKILHPTILGKLYPSVSAKEVRTVEDKGKHALKSAVCYLTVTSLTPAECLHHLGQDKASLMVWLRSMTEFALREADVTISDEMSTLQALVFYLYALRSNDASRRAWTLTSLAVRLAQALDLHCETRHDEHLFSYSTFDTELRRRLWWQITLLERHASYDRASDRMLDYSTNAVQLPWNINDSDLDIGNNHVLQDRTGFTDMTFILVCHEVFDTERRLNFVASSSKNDSLNGIEDWWESRRRLAFDCENRLRTKYLNQCDNSMPIQRYTTMIGEIMIAIMWLIVYRPMQRHPCQRISLSSPPEGLLQLAMKIVDDSIKVTNDPGVQHFRWVSSIWVQWHALAVMLAELHTQVEGAIVERAWALLDEVFDRVGEQVADYRQGRLWKSVKKMMASARQTRNRHLELLRKSNSTMVDEIKNRDPDAQAVDWHPHVPTGELATTAVSGFSHPLDDQQTVFRDQVGSADPFQNTAIWEGSWTDASVDGRYNVSQQAWTEWESFVDEYQNMAGLTS